MDPSTDVCVCENVFGRVSGVAALISARKWEIEVSRGLTRDAGEGCQKPRKRKVID